MTRRIVSTFCLTVVFLSFTCGAFAHNLWINPSDHFPKVGDTVTIDIAWGHTYKANRKDQEMKAGKLAFIRVIDPDGAEVTPTTLSETQYTLPVTKAGAYQVTAGITPGVFTKTTKGRQWCDKKGVKNPLSCTSFAIEAKTLIVAGQSAAGLDRTAGQPLEVVALSNPETVKPGGAFDVKVLFRDQPAEGVTVNAVYAGFAEEMDVAPHNPEAAKGDKTKGPRFPVSAVTDNTGKASLPLTKKGYWMISICHKTPYPDPDVCDEYMNNMAFTFEI
ncbi:hypothetical protein JCM14469_23990 [Desulfatiferula olefinivorans]